MIKVGIFFGGKSREREISFAGGRTVYDNLDKRLFIPVPIFVDYGGHFVELDWPFVYRGSIRDFYPPVEFLPFSPNSFQIYSDCLRLSESEMEDSLSKIGIPIRPEQLAAKIDIAFLALHGAGGEDGSIQGMLEWLGIPYTGSGILPSSLGMNKGVQKDFQKNLFKVPKYWRIRKDVWDRNPEEVYDAVVKEVGFPMVLKPANQGSSIGVNVIRESNFETFKNGVASAFFKKTVTDAFWQGCDKVQFVRDISDIRDGLGLPIMMDGLEVLHPEQLLELLDEKLRFKESLTLEAVQGEQEVLAESFIKGKEFSCIVISDDNGKPIALPPTEIIKGLEVFDYKSKYLPGLSRKVTPIELPDSEIERIRHLCTNLYQYFCFDVYARIDGFYSEEKEIFLNDPNTTSGMMPSSFFFHQAAEIGLNPSQFLTCIIRNSLRSRAIQGVASRKTSLLMKSLDRVLKRTSGSHDHRKVIAIIMGGYSSERHISIESGRNVFEKLSSSGKYRPIPIFLSGDENEHRLFIIPVNVLLKDNADDIRQKVEHFYRVEVINKMIDETRELTLKYAPDMPGFEPREVSYHELATMCEAVFIALHGRPGEDGAVQYHLERVGLPYNGSGIESSQITINKFITNRILRDNGFLVADNFLILESDWKSDAQKVISLVERMGYPLIAKPTDEGCSSAVVKLKNNSQLKAYAELAFRKTQEKNPISCEILRVNAKDEFPRKHDFLVEKFIEKGNALHFLEVTGGVLTGYNRKGDLQYEVFEPSEALAEGEVLSLAEKFLAGEGQNITPARFSSDPISAKIISKQVRAELEKVARLLNIEGYCRIDAFVKIYKHNKAEVIFIEINSLPGMTPATCIYHQAAINGYKPFEFIDRILTFGMNRQKKEER
jgi:D-alanine-D-alanine ligase